MGRRSLRARQAGAATRAAVAAAVALLPAGVAGAPDQVPLQEVLATLPVGGVPALHVLLVDTSASMAEDGRYAAVGEAVTEFVDALPPGDRVSVVTFDVAPRRCGAGVLDAADVAAVTACLPPVAEGDFTDVGRALDEVLDLLEGEEAAVRSLVLVSDGAQEPAPGSPYAADGVGEDPAWLDLADRAVAAGDVDAYALPLLGSESAEVLGAVFPSPTILQASSAEEIRAALQLPRQAARAAQAAGLLAPDAERGIGVAALQLDVVPGEPQTWEITLRSEAEHVPYTVGGIELRPAAGTGVDLEVSGVPGTLRLGPGETATVRATVRVTATEPPPGATPGEGPGGRPAPGGRPVPVTVVADVASTWDDVLADLEVDAVDDLAAELAGLRLVEAAEDDPPGEPAPALARWVVLTTALLLVAAGAFMAWRVLGSRAGGGA